MSILPSRIDLLTRACSQFSLCSSSSLLHRIDPDPQLQRWRRPVRLGRGTRRQADPRRVACRAGHAQQQTRVMRRSTPLPNFRWLHARWARASTTPMYPRADATGRWAATHANTPFDAARWAPPGLAGPLAAAGRARASGQVLHRRPRKCVFGSYF
jgi:hypothetical protein